MGFSLTKTLQLLGYPHDYMETPSYHPGAPSERYAELVVCGAKVTGICSHQKWRFFINGKLQDPTVEVRSYHISGHFLEVYPTIDLKHRPRIYGIGIGTSILCGDCGVITAGFTVDDGLHGQSRIKSGWWFGTFFIFPDIGNNHPN